MVYASVSKEEVNKIPIIGGAHNLPKQEGVAADGTVNFPLDCGLEFGASANLTDERSEIRNTIVAEPHT